MNSNHARNKRLIGATMVAKAWPLTLSGSVVVIGLLIIGLSSDLSNCEVENIQPESVISSGDNVDPGATPLNDDKQEDNSGCVMVDGLCLSPSDVPSYEAIKALHTHLDDDHSGDIDLTESVDFLRKELNYTKGVEKRQMAFHPNDDHHISVHELWNNWLANEVHNWTVEQTVWWLHEIVELGQYAEVFYENAINGSLLPRLAANHEQYLTRILGIKNITHKSKISIKAMDAVLFKASKETGSPVKDIFIASLIVVIVVLLLKFRQMNRNNSIVVSKMEQDMEELRRFHDKFQEELEKNSDDIQPDIDEEPPTPPSPSEASDEPTWKDGDSMFLAADSPERESLLSGEMPDLDIESKNLLQLWLQMTHEKEKVAFEDKVKEMTRKFQEAKKNCEKLKPSRKNLFGALSFIHGNIESREQFIDDTRHSLQMIQEMKKNMEVRWNAMEDILGFPIKHNSGLPSLELTLQPFLQTPMISHPASSEGGITGTGLEGRAETPSSIRNRLNCPPEHLWRQRLSTVRPRSVVSDATSETIFDPSFRISGGSVRSLAPTSPQSPLQHSYTVGAGLSNQGLEDYRPRSSSSESKVRKISSISQPGNISSKNGVNGNYFNNNNINNGYSTDETDSGKYTIGESSLIEVESNSVRLPESRSSIQTHPPSASSLQESTREESHRIPSAEKRIGKFSSEPTLEIAQSPAQTPRNGNPSPKSARKTGFLNKKSWISKKLRSSKRQD